MKLVKSHEQEAESSHCHGHTYANYSKPGKLMKRAAIPADIR
jgi:hypothetical protein